MVVFLTCIKGVFTLGLITVWVMVIYLSINIRQHMIYSQCAIQKPGDSVNSASKSRRQFSRAELFGIQPNYTGNSSLDNIREDQFVVPNIVHFVFFSIRNNKTFTLLNALAVMSAARYIRPSVIHVHGDRKPPGEWWTRLARVVPTLRFTYRRVPTLVFGREVRHMEHASDIARLEILLGTATNTSILIGNFNLFRIIVTNSVTSTVSISCYAICNMNMILIFRIWRNLSRF